jgi:hypothetical protein
MDGNGVENAKFAQSYQKASAKADHAAILLSHFA